MLRPLAQLLALEPPSPPKNATPRAAPRAITAAGLLDSVAAWKALPKVVQDRIGAAAIAYTLGSIGSAEGLSPDQGWTAAELEAKNALFVLLKHHAPFAFDQDRKPLRPDLRALGIRTCRTCGCTDSYGCPGGCRWEESNLCSSCAAQQEPPVVNNKDACDEPQELTQNTAPGPSTPIP